MLTVRTDHHIAAPDVDTMVLADRQGNEIVTCTREADHWVIGEDTFPDRHAAITGMVARALETLPGDGYSCLVPEGLGDMP